MGELGDILDKAVIAAETPLRERITNLEAERDGWEKAARECAGHCHHYCLSRVQLESDLTAERVKREEAESKLKVSRGEVDDVLAHREAAYERAEKAETEELKAQIQAERLCKNLEKTLAERDEALDVLPRLREVWDDIRIYSPEMDEVYNQAGRVLDKARKLLNHD